ncbi:MAG: ATP-binding protein, partial [bacterium]
KSKKKQDAITEITLVKMPSDDGALEAVVAVLRDVTDLHILKSHLRHSQKLEAIGLLASGFAHNINSPLAAIIMTAEMAILNNPDAREWNDILQAAARVTDIVTNLMIKTRQEQSEEEVEIDINELVQTELKFLEANLFFKHIIELDLQLNEKLPSVKGLYGDFSQCFQNLVQNALDAMTQGEETRLTVRTELSEQGQSIILKVKDTGCGIPQEYVNKIFDPFFSTKSLTDDADQFRPSGTGLGLHTSQQLLQKYGANIRVSSEPGDGTEFTITIPVISQNKNEKAS